MTSPRKSKSRLSIALPCFKHFVSYHTRCEWISSSKALVPGDNQLTISPPRRFRYALRIMIHIDINTQFMFLFLILNAFYTINEIFKESSIWAKNEFSYSSPFINTIAFIFIVLTVFFSFLVAFWVYNCFRLFFFLKNLLNLLLNSSLSIDSVSLLCRYFLQKI